ncbi:MAG: hypothetical protein KDC95_15915 [Planctomycetes bacterium]|nr:hypothetical protein [Planctomycetota bacterium]
MNSDSVPSTSLAMRAACALLLSAGIATAQGSVGPHALGSLQECVGLGLTKLGVLDAEQINFVQLPSDPPGTYYVSLTVYGLSTARGGAGSDDLLTGRYDILTDTFTENLDAAGLNTAGTEFMLGMHSSGLFAVFDRPGLSLQFASRGSVTSPFVDRGSITGVPFQSWYDPNLATVDGKLHLVCRINNDLAMMPLDTTTLVAGTPTVIARSTGSGQLNSSAPILDANGEMIGISYHDLIGNDNDHWVSFDLDPATPGHVVLDNATFYSNGSFFGGRYFAALSDSSGYRITQRDYMWCAGGVGPVGGSMDIAAYVPADLAASSISFLMISASYANPVTIPGFTGSFGLGVAGWNIFGMGPHAKGTARASLSLAIPQDASLKGIVVPAQALTIETKASQFVFGNTCSLRVK